MATTRIIVKCDAIECELSDVGDETTVSQLKSKIFETIGIRLSTMKILVESVEAAVSREAPRALDALADFEMIELSDVPGVSGLHTRQLNLGEQKVPAKPDEPRQHLVEFTPLNKSQKLLILNFDNTIFNPDRGEAKLPEVLRSFLYEFLRQTNERYNIAVWSHRDIEWINGTLRIFANPEYCVSFCIQYVPEDCTAPSATLRRKLAHGKLINLVGEKYPEYSSRNTVVLDDGCLNSVMNSKTEGDIRANLQKLEQYLNVIVNFEDVSPLVHEMWWKYQIPDEQTSSAPGFEENFIAQANTRGFTQQSHAVGSKVAPQTHSTAVQTIGFIQNSTPFLVTTSNGRVNIPIRVNAPRGCSTANALRQSVLMNQATSTSGTRVVIGRSPIAPLNPLRDNKKLLVLDIDDTLGDCSSATGPVARPFLHEFLSRAYEDFDIVLWSASGGVSIRNKMAKLKITDNPCYSIAFTVDYTAMVDVRVDNQTIKVKPLQFIWMQYPHFSARNTIMIDDRITNFTLNPSAGLRIKPFPKLRVLRYLDHELLKLKKYIKFLATVEDFTIVSHQDWEIYILAYYGKLLDEDLARTFAELFGETLGEEIAKQLGYEADADLREQLGENFLDKLIEMFEKPEGLNVESLIQSYESKNPTMPFYVTVKYQNQKQKIQGLNYNVTLTELKRRIFAETSFGIPPELQIIFYPEHYIRVLSNKYKSCKVSDSNLTLGELGIRPGYQLMLMSLNNKRAFEEVEADDLIEEMEEEVAAEADSSLEMEEEIDDDNELEEDGEEEKTEEEDVAIGNAEICLVEIEEKIENYVIYELNPLRENKKLLVLDMDHTLYDAHTDPAIFPDVARPFLGEFLSRVYKHYDLVIWSGMSMKSIRDKMKQLEITDNPNYKIAFCLDNLAMISVCTSLHGLVDVKLLGLIWGKYPGYSARNTIILDDKSTNFIMNRQSGLRVTPYRDAALNRGKDRELLKLAEYLEAIAKVDDFRTLNHSTWEEYKAKG